LAAAKEPFSAARASVPGRVDAHRSLDGTHRADGWSMRSAVPNVGRPAFLLALAIGCAFLGAACASPVEADVGESAGDAITHREAAERLDSDPDLLVDAEASAAAAKEGIARWHVYGIDGREAKSVVLFGVGNDHHVKVAVYTRTLGPTRARTAISESVSDAENTRSEFAIVEYDEKGPISGRGTRTAAYLAAVQADYPRLEELTKKRLLEASGNCAEARGIAFFMAFTSIGVGAALTVAAGVAASTPPGWVLLLVFAKYGTAIASTIGGAIELRQIVNTGTVDLDRSVLKRAFGNFGECAVAR